MGINVKAVAQFAKLFAGKSTGVAGAKVGKNMITYMKYGDEITKTVARADGHTITGTFKQVGGKWRPVNVVQQNAKGTINTDLLGYGIKSITIRSAASPNTVATCFSNPFQESVYKMSLDGGKTFSETNRILYEGLRLAIKG